MVSRKLAYFTTAPDAPVPPSPADVTYTEAFVPLELLRPRAVPASTAEDASKARADRDGTGSYLNSLDGSTVVCRTTPRGLPTDGILAGISDLLREVMIPAVSADTASLRGNRGAVFHHGPGSDEGAFDALSRSAVRYSTLLHEMARSMSSVVDIQLPFDGLGMSLHEWQVRSGSFPAGCDFRALNVSLR